MRSTILAAGLCLLTLGAGLAGPSAAVAAALAQSPPCTTPAARQFCAWLEAFNSGQPDTLRQFFETSLPERLPKIDQEIALQRGTGGFRLDKVEVERPDRFTALILERNTGVEVRCIFEVNLRTPNRVSRMDLQAVRALAPNAPIPDRLGTTAPVHDKPFWRAIAKDSYHLPAGASLVDLTAELVDRLASPDPEWRDEIAYSTLTSWIYQQKLLDGSELHALTSELLTNLTRNIGSDGTDDVFRRSFSALVLSVVVARDNAGPVLDYAGRRAILNAALEYLTSERDIRGYVPEKGWAHSAAHTSDLLKFLARGSAITPADQARILATFSQKLTSIPAVFVFGEDERIARAILSIVNRKDFDLEGFNTWLAASTPRFPAPSALSVQSLQSFQNLKNVLAKLEVLIGSQDSTAGDQKKALDAIRTALKAAF